MASMLDYNPQLQVGMERFAFDYLLGEKLDKDKSDSLVERINAFDWACQLEAKQSKNKWGNKITTEQIAALGNTLNSDWPTYIDVFSSKVIRNRKVLFIVRDGRACVSSKIKRTGQSYEEALSRWKLSILLLNHLQEKNLNLHICKYEDLVTQPEKVLTLAAEFLGVQFHSAMLEGPKNPNMPKIYKGEALRAINVEEQWPEGWTADMKRELEQLGYL